MTAFSVLTVEALIDIVKGEAARREGKPATGPLRTGVSGSGPTISLAGPRYLVATPRRHIRDFLPLLGEEFISEAFTTLLWRPADISAKEAYLSALVCGRASRWEVLLRIRLSAEGRKRGANLRWLFPAALFSVMFRVPVLGICLNAAAHALAFPPYLRDTRQQDLLAFSLLRSLGR